MSVGSESLSIILDLTVYIAAEPDFVAHSALADYASALLTSELGETAIGYCTAIGVATFPGNAPVELQLVASVR